MGGCWHSKWLVNRARSGEDGTILKIEWHYWPSCKNVFAYDTRLNDSSDKELNLDASSELTLRLFPADKRLPSVICLDIIVLPTQTKQNLTIIPKCQISLKEGK